jgi:hypothetical protein
MADEDDQWLYGDSNTESQNNIESTADISQEAEAALLKEVSIYIVTLISLD